MSLDYIFDWYSDLRARRANWETHWDECARYTDPRKSEIWNRAELGGRKKTSRLYDGTAIDANEFFASSLHGLLISYTEKWFKIETDNADLNQQEDVLQWSEDVTDIMHSVIHDPRAKFTENFDEVCLDLGTFGTGVFSVQEGEEIPVMFDSNPVTEEYLSENAAGVIDVSMRVFEWSARKIRNQFPDTYERSDRVKKALSKGGNPEEMIEVLHAIYPRTERIPGKLDNKNKPFASVYGLLGEKIVLAESGFDEFPKMTPRWRKTSKETYGRSPTMKALPDIKMLNAMEKGLVGAVELILNPPLDVPDKAYVGKIRTYAGAVNYRRQTVGNQRIEAINTVGNLPLPENKAEQKRDAVRRAYYNHLFVLPEESNMTATEVFQRRAERMQVVMPMLGRIQSELISAILERVYNILDRKGLLPQPPSSINNRRTRIRYLSQFARIQSTIDVESVVQTVGFAGQMAQLNPEVLDNIDFDASLKLYGNARGFPTAGWTSNDSVQQERQARQEAAQQQARAQQALAASEVARNASQQ